MLPEKWKAYFARARQYCELNMKYRNFTISIQFFDIETVNIYVASMKRFMQHVIKFTF